MKALVFIALLLFPLSGVVAQATAPQIDLTTVSGKTYKAAKVLRVEADGVTYMFAGGIVTIPLSDLPEPTRKQYADQVAVATLTQTMLATNAATPANAPLPAPRRPHKDNVYEVSYTSCSELRSELAKRANALMLDAAQRDQEEDEIPAGGRVRVILNRATIEFANTKYYTFIVMDSSRKVLLRKKGRDRIPSSTSGRSWFNSAVIDLPEFTGALILRVACEVDNTFEEYSIANDGTAPVQLVQN